MDMLKDKINYCLDNSDLEDIFNKLASIKGPTAICGVGGSSVVSVFLVKVLSNKNGIIADEIMPRDMLYRPLDGYQNVIACSYSGGNIGVTASFENNLNKYLFSAKPKEFADVNITYDGGKPDDSFVSIAATFMPMSIALLYYCDGNREVLDEILNSDLDFDVTDELVYEVMSGYESYTGAKMLESTLCESGCGAALIHDKYNYCHGRGTYNYHNHNSLIYFRSHNELEYVFARPLEELYKNIIYIDNKYQDNVINDFYCTYMALKLCVKIAQLKGKDISRVEVSDFSEEIYVFKGNM